MAAAAEEIVEDTFPADADVAPPAKLRIVSDDTEDGHKKIEFIWKLGPEETIEEQSHPVKFFRETTLKVVNESSSKVYTYFNKLYHCDKQKYFQALKTSHLVGFITKKLAQSVGGMLHVTDLSRQKEILWALHAIHCLTDNESAVPAHYIDFLFSETDFLSCIADPRTGHKLGSHTLLVKDIAADTLSNLCMKRPSDNDWNQLLTRLFYHFNDSSSYVFKSGVISACLSLLKFGLIPDHFYPTMLDSVNMCYSEVLETLSKNTPSNESASMLLDRLMLFYKHYLSYCFSYSPVDEESVSQTDTESLASSSQTEIESPASLSQTEIESPASLSQTEIESPNSLSQPEIDSPASLSQTETESPIYVSEIETEIQTSIFVSQTSIGSPIHVSQIETEIQTSIPVSQTETESSIPVSQMEIESSTPASQAKKESSGTDSQTKAESSPVSPMETESSTPVSQSEIESPISVSQMEIESPASISQTEMESPDLILQTESVSSVPNLSIFNDRVIRQEVNDFFTFDLNVPCEYPQIPSNTNLGASIAPHLPSINYSFTNYIVKSFLEETPTVIGGICNQDDCICYNRPVISKRNETATAYARDIVTKRQNFDKEEEDVTESDPYYDSVPSYVVSYPVLSKAQLSVWENISMPEYTYNDVYKPKRKKKTKPSDEKEKK